MGSLAAMLSSLVATDVSLAVARYKRNAVISTIASVFFITAYIFALVAGRIYLSRFYTPLQSTLIIAGVFAVTGIILIGVMLALNARDKKIAAERRRRAQAPTALAMATAMTLLRRKPLVAAGLAVGVGTALSFLRKPGHRD